MPGQTKQNPIKGELALAFIIGLLALWWASRRGPSDKPASPPAVMTPASAVAPVTARTPLRALRVWVDTKSGIYYYEGEAEYGRAWDGQTMNETDAVKRGYRRGPGFSRLER